MGFWPLNQRFPIKISKMHQLRKSRITILIISEVSSEWDKKKTTYRLMLQNTWIFLQYKVQCQRTLNFNYRWRSVFMKSQNQFHYHWLFFCNDIPDPYSGLKIAIISKVHPFDKTNQPSTLFPNIQIDNSKLRLKFKITWRNITIH